MKIINFIFGLSIIFAMQNAQAFNYQGELSQAGELYSGTADLNFKLFDDETIGTGMQVGLEDVHSSISVVNGRFVVELNQWIGLFDGNDYWLEISASIPASSGNFTTLSPRQKIGPVPYSEYAYDYDLDTSGLQNRVTGSCGADEAMSLINQNGSVSCTSFAKSNQSCGSGQTVTGVSSNGTVICGALVPAPPNCDQVNQALQYNSGTGWACVDVSTIGASSGNAQGYEATDSWGLTFDGKERPTATWADANQMCENLGGRLPTISELYRVSSAFKGEVASSYETNYLWSRTWWDKVNKSIVRLTDGFVTSSNVNNLRPYRCVWPTATPGFFAGSQCMGEPGNECWDHVGHPTGKMAMDMMDRPAVPLAAATDECSFVNAHVAHQQDYVENIINNLPNGTDEWLWTSDSVNYEYNGIVRWLNTESSYNDYSKATGNSRQSSHKFRCTGVSYAAGEHPTTVASEFVASNTKIKADSGVTTAALYGDSINGCFAAGGHLAHSRDIMELVRAGMGNGPGTDYIWMADRSRYDFTQISRWTGSDASYTGYNPEYATWSTINASTTTRQHRCAYYPIDADYTHPTAASCSADISCATFDNAASKLAIDTVDRPPATYASAIQTCVNEGGRLATSLQLTEAIRAGLANGSNTFLWTADSTWESNSYSTSLKWTAIESTFSPIYSGSATNSVKSNSQSYRCAWTNELW